MRESFIFGGQTGLSYDQIQKQRDIANELLRANMYTPQNVGEGLSAIGRALAAKAIDKRTTRADEANRKAYEASRDEAFRALGGYGGSGGANYAPSGTWTPAPPAPKPTDNFMGNPDTVFSGGNSFNMPAPADAPQPSAPLSFGAAVMTPQEMLIEGAKARGLDPIDVATAISYETGGKFDPMISGPTTQWGTHKGLIQFGEPQAAEHGVDFSNADAAWRSQLNPTSGAVWSYLDSTGVKPGMGLDQIYSAINAGGVNRFGASDANNGGAPGTVADKVAGMAPHRENAAKFLGGTWTPNEGQQPQQGFTGSTGVPAGMPNPAILMALADIQGNPYASDSDKAIASLLMQQTVQAMDPMRQMEMEKARLELDALKNPQPGFTLLNDEQEAQMGLNPAGVYQQGADGSIKVVQDAPKADGPTSAIQEYEFARSQGYEGTFQQYQADLKKAGASSTTVNNTLSPDAPGPGADEEALRGALGKKEGEAWATYIDSAVTSSGTMQDMQLLDEIIKVAPQGPLQGRLAEAFPGVNAAADAFQSVVKRVAPTLRAPGSGATSDIEYDGMLKSLPRLSSTPEANQAIAGMMKAKAQINMQRGEIVRAYQNGELSLSDARRQINEIDKQSIMSPELKALIDNLGPAPQSAAGQAPEGVDQEVWDVMTDEERALFK